MGNRALGSVVRIGLIAGTLDIADSLIFNAFRHITPERIFQYIASALTGRWAFGAGLASVLLGAAIHYAIAFFWTAVYWWASGRAPVLVRRPVVCGFVYGAVIYLIMNFWVLPRTRLPHARAAATPAAQINAVLAMLFCIGVTVAVLMARDRRAGIRV